jgi:glycosyltransferase involved in cell wall biosynthesis
MKAEIISTFKEHSWSSEQNQIGGEHPTKVLGEGRPSSQGVPIYQLEWSDEDCRWAASTLHAVQSDPVKLTCLLTTETPFFFEIVAPVGRLDGISVMLSAREPGISVPLLCELADARGQIITAETTLTSGTTDRFHRILDLRAISLGIGEKYFICLSISSRSAGATLALPTIAGDGSRVLVPRKIVGFRHSRLFVYREGEQTRRAKSGARCVIALPPQLDARARGAALMRASTTFPSQKFDVVELDSAEYYWPVLSSADLVLFAALDQPADASLQGLCFALHRRGVCTVAAGGAGIREPSTNPFNFMWHLGPRMRRLQSTMQRCHFYFTDEASPILVDSMTNEALTQSRTNSQSENHRYRPETLIDSVRALRLPRVAVVSVLYRKADVINTFIDHVVRQTYPGEITIVLVDDCSPDDDLAKAQLYQTRLAARELPDRRIVTVKNEVNLGNCASRLAGLAAHEADIYVVIDCDCLLNRDFVAAHVFEHAWRDVDVVIGPMNIEAGDRDPCDLVRELETFPERIPSRTQPQDPIQQDSFLNCITRNFSIKRRCVGVEPLFDLDFSYSNRPGSGFGWEDVEMGYRLYQRGAVIRFTPYAFSVHCTHPSSVGETAKAGGSMRNFERLFQKHPELAIVARRWAVDTYDRIRSWANSIGFDGGPVQRSLESRFSTLLDDGHELVSLYRGKSRSLRILTYRWHVPHQYELYKLPHSFTLATGSSNGMINNWGYEQRPLRPNVRMVPMSEIDPRDFDLAILHFDENVLDPHLCNNVMPPVWGEPFLWLLSIRELPKIAICHGTPQFHGQYGLDPKQKTEFIIYEAERRRLVDALSAAGASVVCNSHQSHSEWGFQQSRTIWQGFDPQEFPPATYERDVLALEPDPVRIHYRGMWEQDKVERRLDPKIRIETARHRGAAIEIEQSNAFAVKNYRSYVDRIRQFTVYLNTTLRSPMPRSRGEAMMTGVVPVCLDNHDVNMFIQPAINGFYSKEPEELADFTNYMISNKDEARRVGAAARKTALDLFNHDRYLNEWCKLIKEVIG